MNIYSLVIQKVLISINQRTRIKNKFPNLLKHMLWWTDKMQCKQSSVTQACKQTEKDGIVHCLHLGLRRYLQDLAFPFSFPLKYNCNNNYWAKALALHTSTSNFMQTSRVIHLTGLEVLSHSCLTLPVTLLQLCAACTQRACSEGGAGSPAVKCCLHDLVVHLQKLQFRPTDCLWIILERQSAWRAKKAYFSSLSPSMGMLRLPSVRLFTNLNADWCPAVHGEESTKCWCCSVLFHFSVW